MYLSRAVSWCSRCRHADSCRSTRPPTKKYRLVLFFFPFSVRSSLIACSWLRFVTCVPQHMLLSTPSIVTTRTAPLWSSGSPLVLTYNKGLTSSSGVLFQCDSGYTQLVLYVLQVASLLIQCFPNSVAGSIITDSMLS
jgi:hypothetical protein